jgi:hypothetical protein
MRICFVSTSRGSYFMTELLAALAAATEAAGHDVELVFDKFPRPIDGRVYVVVPHEFEAWGLRSGSPDAEQRARTIALCTENPGTEWFEATSRLVSSFGAAVSINRSSAAELRRRGVRCEHLQLGYCARWDSWHREQSANRPIDILYLGAADPRRDPLLADIGIALWSRECQFLVPPLEPRTGPRSDFLKDTQKYERLAQSKILLNLHRTTSAALEWMRFLEAICNGCVVLSEPSLDGDPLIAGEHFVETPVTDIGAAAGALLNDPVRLRQLSEQAYDFVREQLPIAPAGVRLAELAAELPRTSAAEATSLRRVDWASSANVTASPSTGGTSVAVGSDHTPIVHGAQVGDHARSSLLAGVGRLLGARRARPSGSLEIETSSYRAAKPRVSVLGIITGETRDEADQQIESIIASDGGTSEIILVSGKLRDHDDSAVTRLFAEHPSVPMLMLRAPLARLAERGAADAEEACPAKSKLDTQLSLGAARNLLAARARGEYLLVLPPAGGVFPSTIERLTRALEADRLATFAYPMVAVIDCGSVVELRGSLPWEERRLSRTNWIDPPFLIRRERLLELGSWATDPRLSGLEDFDLWRRIADHSDHGTHVSQVLGWHAAEQPHPRDIAALEPASCELLRERAPRLSAET